MLSKGSGEVTYKLFVVLRGNAGQSERPPPPPGLGERKCSASRPPEVELAHDLLPQRLEGA